MSMSMNSWLNKSLHPTMKRCLYKYPFEYPFAPIYGGSASLCSQCETWLELFQFKQCLKSFTGKLHAHFMGLEPRISPFSLLLQQEELILKLESLQQWLNFFELSSYIISITFFTNLTCFHPSLFFFYGWFNQILLSIFCSTMHSTSNSITS